MIYTCHPGLDPGSRFDCIQISIQPGSRIECRMTTQNKTQDFASLWNIAILGEVKANFLTYILQYVIFQTISIFCRITYSTFRYRQC